MRVAPQIFHDIVIDSRSRYIRMESIERGLENDNLYSATLAFVSLIDEMNLNPTIYAPGKSEEEMSKMLMTGDSQLTVCPQTVMVHSGNMASQPEELGQAVHVQTDKVRGTNFGTCLSPLNLIVQYDWSMYRSPSRTD